jgi:HEAT repeat protein
MNTRTLTTLLIALLGMLTSTTSLAQKSLPPERAAAAREALVAWFECVECGDGELERLLQHGVDVESALISTLRNGPSPAKRAEIEERLRAQYRANKWPPKEEKEYLAANSANAEQIYRLRAITALGRLGTPAALDALKEAASERSGYSDMVRRAAQDALRANG